MKGKKIILSLGVVALTGVLGVGVFAAGAATRPSGDFLMGDLGGGASGPLRQLIHGQLRRLMALRSQVNLSSEQREEIADVVRKHRTEIASALEPVIQDRRVLRDAIASGSADETAIRSDADQLGKAIGDAAVLASHIKAEARGILTPQQQQSIDQFRQQSDAAVDQAIQRFAGA